MCHAAWYLNPPQHCPRTRISERLLLCTERLSHGHSHHLLPRGYTVTLALRVWVCPDLVLSRCSRGAWSQGGGPPICWKVVRACSQPQGMFLHFETRLSDVGECARGEVLPQTAGWTLRPSAAPETSFQSYFF